MRLCLQKSHSTQCTLSGQLTLVLPVLFSLSLFLLFSFFFSFLQPERIDPPDPTKPDYDIRADVWSLGISLVSLSFQSVPLVVIFTSMTLKDSCKIRTERQIHSH